MPKICFEAYTPKKKGFLPEKLLSLQAHQSRGRLFSRQWPQTRKKNKLAFYRVFDRDFFGRIRPQVLCGSDSLDLVVRIMDPGFDPSPSTDQYVIKNCI